MSMFLSYTRADQERVQSLTEDLQRLGRPPWLDREIHGGAPWWREIIHRIQTADVFLFALSEDSLRSRPCQLELRYADQLRIPVIPIMVGDIGNRRVPVASRHIIDYRTRSADVVIELVAAITELESEPRRLPDPLPDPPPVPFEYLYRLAGAINVEEIPRREQGLLIAELRQQLRDEDDEVARHDIVGLLQQLAGRPEITALNLQEIEAVLNGNEARSVPVVPGGVTRLPASDIWRNRSGESDAPTVVLDPERPDPPDPPEPTAPEPSTRPTEPARRAEAPAGDPPPGERAPAPAADVVDEPVADGAVPDWILQRLHTGPSTARPAPEAPAPAPIPGAARPDGGPPDWMTGRVEPTPAISPAPPVDDRPSTSPAPATGWPNRPGRAPAEPAPPPRRSALAGAALGAAGIPLLALGPAVAGSRPPAVPVVTALVLVATLAGLVVSAVALRRGDDGARWALALSAIGLIGAVLFAVTGQAFGG